MLNSSNSHASLVLFHCICQACVISDETEMHFLDSVPLPSFTTLCMVVWLCYFVLFKLNFLAVIGLILNANSE